MRRLSLMVSALAALSLGWVVVDVSDGGFGFVGALIAIWSPIVLGATLFLAVFVAVVWNRLRSPDYPSSLRSPALFVALSLIVLQLVLTFTGASDGLFKLRLQLSKPALMRHVNDALQRDLAREEWTAWIGLFRIEETQVVENPLAVRMITTECHFVDRCGIVYSPDGEPSRLGEDIYHRVDDGWWFWRESW